METTCEATVLNNDQDTLSLTWYNVMGGSCCYGYKESDCQLIVKLFSPSTHSLMHVLLNSTQATTKRSIYCLCFLSCILL